MGKHVLGTDIGVVSGFHHMSDLKPAGHPLEAVVHNFSPFEELLQLQVQLVAIKSAILLVHVLAYCKKAGNSIEDCMDSLICSGCA